MWTSAEFTGHNPFPRTVCGDRSFVEVGAQHEVDNQTDGLRLPVPIVDGADMAFFKGITMRTFVRHVNTIATVIAATTAILVLTPNQASAHTTAPSSFSCGYNGYSRSNGNQPLYTHCGTGRVEIEVDHFFWQETHFCATRGTQEIPQGSSQWRIIGAEYDGKSC